MPRNKPIKLLALVTQADEYQRNKNAGYDLTLYAGGQPVTTIRLRAGWDGPYPNDAPKVGTHFTVTIEKNEE